MNRTCPHCNKEGIKFQAHSWDNCNKSKTDYCTLCNKEVAIPNHAAWVVLFLIVSVVLFFALVYLFHAIFSTGTPWFSSWIQLLVLPVVGFIFISYVFNFLYQRFVPIKAKR